jgi:hypothetical protein
MNKKVVGSMSEWSGMLRDLFRQINDGSISLPQLQAFIEHRNPFEAINPITDWQKFYSEVFGIECNFSNLRLPQRKEGFDRLIVVAEGMTLKQIYKKCKESFPCWKWTDRNFAETVNSERTAENGAYAVWFRNRVEADEELRNFSVKDLEKANIPCITLEERLLYELKYFTETGKHLDIKSITLCAGSRYSSGYVPDIRWGNSSKSKLDGRWTYLDCRYRSLRSRRAVL